jgi:hypothetical protein
MPSGKASEKDHNGKCPMLKLFFRHKQQCLREDSFCDLRLHSLAEKVSTDQTLAAPRKYNNRTWYQPTKPSRFHTRARMSNAPACLLCAWWYLCASGSFSRCSFASSASALRAWILTLAIMYGYVTWVIRTCKRYNVVIGHTKNLQSSQESCLARR